MKLKEEIKQEGRGTESQQARQLFAVFYYKKNSLALGGCKLDNNLFFGALTGLNAEHSLVHQRCMFNSPNGKAY